MPYNLSGLKAALTRARKTGDPNKVIACRNAAIRIFEEYGYPDCWQDWDRAVADTQCRYLNRAFNNR